jgi:DNA modification methylase
MTTRILLGDCRTILPNLPDESVHCVVTSPPYWGLRDYGTAKWEGGDPQCDHVKGRPGSDRADGIVQMVSHRNRDGAGAFNGDCKCGARRIDSQIGLEPTPEAYVATMVEVFREVRRVLRSDGTVWLNLGDSYAGYHGNKNSEIPTSAMNGWTNGTNENLRTSSANRNGLKQKDLIGIPWRVAFALQADGWWLRQDIIWSKPNPMPESVTDRCTKAHEYIFLLSKSARYFYDAEAIKEPSIYGDPRSPTAAYPCKNDFREGARPIRESVKRGGFDGKTNELEGREAFRAITDFRNKRSVWEVATAPFSEAHFATFPPALIEPCIKAGTSEKGCCAKCGASWAREVEKINRGGSRVDPALRMVSGASRNSFGGQKEWDAYKPAQTLGWSPSCSCNADAAPCTVLDPFGGAGTTGLLADRLGRNAILIELNPEYSTMAQRRLRSDAPLFADVTLEAAE